MDFNINQQKAIQTRNADILVSAPAGSGKTAVLVERIISLIQEGVNVDELLVLTFTEAAGNEMKQRLLKRINELLKDPTLETQTINNLKQQKLKLSNAYITNFHGFCSTLLKQYGYMIHVMPGFNILSDTESLKRETIQELETTWFENKNFCSFLRTYFPGNKLTAFEELLLSVEALSHSISDFDRYTQNIYEKYYQSLNNGLSDSFIFDLLKNYIKKQLSFSKEALSHLYSYASDHGITAFYEYDDAQIEKNETKPTTYDAYCHYVDELESGLTHALTFDALQLLLNTSIEKSTSISWKKLGIEEETKKEFNKLKESFNKPIKDIKENYFKESETQIIEKIQAGYEPVQMILSLIKDFRVLYTSKKLTNNYLDFNDLEYYCDQLLDNKEVIDKISNKISNIMIDEYQDTNQIQENLINKIVEYNPDKKINVFMVGDMKQSIYRFRQADPEIFRKKYLTYSTDDLSSVSTKTRRIDLGYNYRSSKIILDSINYIFNCIMDEDIGGLDYYLDDSAKLNYDFAGRNENQEDYDNHFNTLKDTSTEILINLKSEDSSYSTAEEEAHMVAQRIIDLHESGLNNKDVHFNDIAVLMKTANEFITFKKVFDLYHIPNHIVLSKGLLESIEYRDLTNMLKAFVHDDTDEVDEVAFMNLLSRPYSFSNISYERIARLHIQYPGISLYKACRLCQDKDIQMFMSEYDRLLSLSYKNLYDLLLELEALSDYELFVSQLINGEQRCANIQLFNEIVKEAVSEHPYLANLINYLESISDRAPAPIASDNNDRVRFMTIHKSKGLEFKVVFVSQIQRKFNMQDVSSKLIIDKTYGFAMNPRRLKKGIIVEYNNAYKKLIGTKIKEETINEEMRVLYVALTRAVDKLILTGSIKSIDEITKIQSQLILDANCDEDRKDSHKIILGNQIRNTTNYLNWILLSALRHPSVINDCLKYDDLKENAQLLKSSIKHINDENTKHALFNLRIIGTQSILDYSNKLNKQLSSLSNNFNQYHQYIYTYDTDKDEVNAVTKIIDYEDDHYNYLDLNTDDLNISATEKGTLVHLLLSELNFDGNDDIHHTIDTLLDNGMCNDEGKSVLISYMPHLQNFINSNRYKDICRSDHLFKEKSFSTYDENLQQIIHGIFDLVYIKDNVCYVLDYKTDRFKDSVSDETLIHTHSQQLNYYRNILEDMYHLKTICITYYLYLNKEVIF